MKSYLAEEKEINKFQFIEQKTPADLEKSAGVFIFLLRSKKNQPIYEDEPFDDFSDKNITLFCQLFFAKHTILKAKYSIPYL